ncbi:hypothetical protein [Glaciimonas immobilis]|uniref:Uncharacterized protein n=1 Tax=Glaciimonas immobilis TaxID=728004 RepID=A0A840RR99_9BURK|nr:hypothetical protein [Glaciimonas immobilis]KAF3996787.1 hypothetical protein HAV38_16480 [Glaciimonas immobilis]MBB5199672.1 hypothetical protein [Glaciimonas immobilis]
MMDIKTLGTKVRQRRLAVGLAQQRLAKRADLSRQTRRLTGAIGRKCGNDRSSAHAGDLAITSSESLAPGHNSVAIHDLHGLPVSAKDYSKDGEIVRLRYRN